VRFAPETLERIDKIAGTYRRPKFIREAVEEKLAREEITR
jgi:predicted transcriptional regulator